ncbi:MAG TPA: glycosyltransferase family 9 protein [Verrucomicrobiae bacterium]|jgi:ADP-heptose:LPS heptosyltransferase|nr:glycosyltransferase family 9 protein [Verrucomicrobiae bacterium]
MTKLILKCGLALGDIVMLTAAVRDLHRCYPKEFVTDVRTPFPDLWKNNPWVQRLDDSDTDVWKIDCLYPLLNRCSTTPYHCLHGFIEFLNDKLRLSIKPTEFKGDIHLSTKEKKRPSPVEEVTGQNTPFWIVAAGGKFDVTIKWWSTERYQQVVDKLQGQVRFVQVGSRGHHHPKLQGTIDLRGLTGIRDLVRLVHHAQGVLCSVTSLMHLAAAVETRHDRPSLRPCVVVAGGREPAHWEQYPGHQFIDTIGTLPCCASTGCWRSRIQPLRDGDIRDQPQRLCGNVVSQLPRCMNMITADEVVRRINYYFEGGLAKRLSSRQARAARQAARLHTPKEFDNQPLTLSSAGMAFDEAAKFIQEKALPEPWQGRGIVLCGGGARYFVNAWVCINMLRHLGCDLPIEVWHLGKREMSKRMASLLEKLDATAVDAEEVRRAHPARILNGWELKPYAVLHSRFEQALFLDADNVPVKNPEYLFKSDAFSKAGAIFWPDFDRPTGNDPGSVWRSCGIRKSREPEFETGQIVLDKNRCWQALRLTMWMNERSDFYYQYLYGDKETFHIAFRKLRQAYALIRKPIHRLEGTMCQHDLSGQRLFQHRNMAKWDLFANRRINGFLYEKKCFSFVEKLREVWDGNVSLNLSLKKKQTPLSQKKPRLGTILLDDSSRTSARGLEKHLRQTDWPTTTPLWRCPDDDLRESLHSALAQALDAGCTSIVLLHGNLIFNRHIYHNLLSWKPFRQGAFDLGSLYDPGVRADALDLPNRARLLRPRRGFSSPAVLISVSFATIFLGQLKAPRTSATDLSMVARTLRQPVHFHAPSLVQFAAPTASLSETPSAFDFDPVWRA